MLAFLFKQGGPPNLIKEQKWNSGLCIDPFPLYPLTHPIIFKGKGLEGGEREDSAYADCDHWLYP